MIALSGPIPASITELRDRQNRLTGVASVVTVAEVKRHWVWLTTLVVGVVAVAALVLTVGPPQADPIKIAAIYNRTGGMKWLDLPGLEGFLLAAQQINADGGILGRKVEVVEADGTTDTTKIGHIASAFAANGDISAIGGVNDPVFAIAPIRGATRRADGGLISFAHSEMALAVGRATMASGIPFVTAGSTLSTLPDEVGEDLFMVAASHTAQAFAAADFARDELGAATVWIVTDQDRPFATELAMSFRQRWQTRGGATPVEDSYPAGEVDISAQIEKLERSNQAPEVIFVASLPNEGGYLIKQMRAAGMTQPIILADVVDARYIAAVADDTSNVFLATHGSLDDPAREIQDFVADYSITYGHRPASVTALLGFDTMRLIADAIERADSAEPDRISLSLARTRDFDALTGSMTYPTGVHVPDKAITIVELRDGQPVIAAVLDPASSGGSLETRSAIHDEPPELSGVGSSSACWPFPSTRS